MFPSLQSKLKRYEDLELQLQDPAVHCNIELGCATMVTIKMAVESYRQRKTMLWDAKNEKVVAS